MIADFMHHLSIKKLCWIIELTLKINCLCATVFTTELNSYNHKILYFTSMDIRVKHGLEFRKKENIGMYHVLVKAYH